VLTTALQAAGTSFLTPVENFNHPRNHPPPPLQHCAQMLRSPVETSKNNLYRDTLEGKVLTKAGLPPRGAPRCRPGNETATHGFRGRWPGLSST
jgi:hypothetical protein